MVLKVKLAGSTAGRVALGLVLAAAAILRFTSLGFGLRHPPFVDEVYFVQSVSRMLSVGTLDHGFYEYPGLFSTLLVPALAFLSPPRLGPSAYLLSRGVVAAFSVLSVALCARLAQRLWGGLAPALLAAALLAVSPVEVETAHMVRPDIVLGTFVLLSSLFLLRVGEGRKGDLQAGVSIGIATAVKFTGALLAPCYLLRRALSPGRRWPRVLLAGGAALLAFAVASPFTFLHARLAVLGLRSQVAYHYVAGPGDLGPLGTALAYGRILLRALGPVGVTLVPVGLWLRRREWRAFLPLALLPVLTVAVFSTATVHEERFLVPVLGLLAVFASAGATALFERGLVVAVAVSAAFLGPPLVYSLQFLSAISRPGTRDLAADWIEQHTPPGARVLVTLGANLGLDGKRFKVVRVDQLDESSFFPALGMKVIAVGPGDDHRLVARLHKLFVAAPETRWSGPRIRLLAPPPELVPVFEPLDLSRAQVRFWTGGIPCLQIDLAEPAIVARVRLPGEGGLHAHRTGSRLSIFVGEPGQVLHKVHAFPADFDATGEPVTLVFAPERAATVRMAFFGKASPPWTRGTIQLDSVGPIPPP